MATARGGDALGQDIARQLPNLFFGEFILLDDVLAAVICYSRSSIFSVDSNARTHTSHHEDKRGFSLGLHGGSLAVWISDWLRRRNGERIGVLRRFGDSAR